MALTSYVQEDAEGQAQATEGVQPHDGKHHVDESRLVTDTVIKDANSDLAVQVPEDCGASTVGHASPMREAFERGTPEEQFEAGQKDADKDAKDAAATAKKA